MLKHLVQRDKLIKGTVLTFTNFLNHLSLEREISSTSPAELLTFFSYFASVFCFLLEIIVTLVFAVTRGLTNLLTSF